MEHPVRGSTIVRLPDHNSRFPAPRLGFPGSMMAPSRHDVGTGVAVGRDHLQRADTGRLWLRGRECRHAVAVRRAGAPQAGLRSAPVRHRHTWPRPVPTRRIPTAAAWPGHDQPRLQRVTRLSPVTRRRSRV